MVTKDGFIKLCKTEYNNNDFKFNLPHQFEWLQFIDQIKQSNYILSY